MCVACAHPNHVGLCDALVDATLQDSYPYCACDHQGGEAAYFCDKCRASFATEKSYNNHLCPFDNG